MWPRYKKPEPSYLWMYPICSQFRTPIASYYYIHFSHTRGWPSHSAFSRGGWASQELCGLVGGTASGPGLLRIYMYPFEILPAKRSLVGARRRGRETCSRGTPTVQVKASFFLTLKPLEICIGQGEWGCMSRPQGIGRDAVNGLIAGLGVGPQPKKPCKYTSPMWTKPRLGELDQRRQCFTD